MCLCYLFKLLIIAPIVQTATSAVHASHSEFYCSQISQLCTCIQNDTVIQPNRSYQSYIYTMHLYTRYVVPISTSGMLAHILTDCSRGAEEGQGEEEEDTKGGMI